VAANVVSCTGAMSFSFTVNGQWLFQPTGNAGVMEQAMRLGRLPLLKLETDRVWGFSLGFETVRAQGRHYIGLGFSWILAC
jgi:hypothetical protein